MMCPFKQFLDYWETAPRYGRVGSEAWACVAGSAKSRCPNGATIPPEAPGEHSCATTQKNSGSLADPCVGGTEG